MITKRCFDCFCKNKGCQWCCIACISPVCFGKMRVHYRHTALSFWRPQTKRALTGVVTSFSPCTRFYVLLLMLRALLEQVTLLLRCALFAQCALLVLSPIPPLPLQRGYSSYVSYYFSDLSSYPCHCCFC